MRHVIRYYAIVALLTVASLSACVSDPESLDIVVTVDFGPANRGQVHKQVTLRDGSTVFEALKATFPVVTSRR